MQNLPKPDLKIHTHFFYTNHFGEPGSNKPSEKLNIISAWEKLHELQQKGWTQVVHSYGKEFPLRKCIEK